MPCFKEKGKKSMHKFTKCCCWFLPSLLLAGCTSLRPDDKLIPVGVDQILDGNDDIDENPSAFVGRNVITWGEVTRILSSNAFILDYGGGFLGMLNNKILVLQPSLGATPLTLGNRMEVIGTIRLFNRSQLESELGASLSKDLFQDYQNKPVLVAKSLRNQS
jgi:hypothetical protein